MSDPRQVSSDVLEDAVALIEEELGRELTTEELENFLENNLDPLTPEEESATVSIINKTN